MHVGDPATPHPAVIRLLKAGVDLFRTTRARTTHDIQDGLGGRHYSHQDDMARDLPGIGCVTSVSDLAPLVGLVRGVQRPGVRQCLLAVIAAHGHQEAVGH